MAALYTLESVNFPANLSASLGSLLSGSQLCDVTLVCDDGQLSAHKVILAASSNFFSSVFQMNPHNHPLMYLRGVKTEHMQCLLQFLYAGTTTMKTEDVPSFLAMAADLKIMGLMENKEKKENCVDSACGSQTFPINEHDSTTDILIEPKQEPNHDETEPELVEQHVFIEKQTPAAGRASLSENSSKEPNQFGKNPSVSAAVENRPNITMVSNSTEIVAVTQKQLPTKNKKVYAGKKSPVIKTASPKSKRPVPVFSIYCPICQTIDRSNSNIKKHMDAKRDVQCKKCGQVFENCQSLSKHIKGRCGDKAKEDMPAKTLTIYK